MRALLGSVVLAWVIIAGSSCGSVRNFQYLRGAYDTAKVSKIQVPVLTIQKGDLLDIEVFSDDPLATAAVTRQISSAAPTSLTLDAATNSIGPAASGYLVNQRGELQLYKLGIIRAEGLTKEQLADSLEALYAQQDLLKNPYVEVRFLNYRVTVIGEVNRPGPYTIPVDKVNAFEAIGLAGDITTYGRRDNILVIREVNGVRQFGRLNLKDPNVFLSPYYYLQQNDLLIVDVYKNKAAVNNQTTVQTISIGASIVSILALVYSIIDRNN